MSKFFVSTDPTVHGELVRLFGSDRLHEFIVDCSGDFNRALQLYVWNAALAAAFLPALGSIEVALRNAVHDCLAKKFTNQWFDESAFLSIDMQALPPGIMRAKRHIASAGRQISPSEMVCQLPFGFWTMLLRPAYARTLWPVLRPAFRRYTRRRRIMELLEPLVTFRNLVAHHRTVYDREPRVMWGRICSGARLLSPELERWIEHHSRVPRLLSDGPVRAITMF
jgi:Abi-like protein